IDRRAILLDDHQPAVVLQRDQDDRRRVPDDLDGVLAPIRKPAALDLDREHSPFIDDGHGNLQTGIYKLQSGFARKQEPRFVNCHLSIVNWSRTCWRSSGSALVNSIRRPSVGCLKTSRAACRNGRSRRVTARRSPGTRRWTPPYSGSPTTGWPIALRCTRIWCVRPV